MCVSVCEQYVTSLGVNIPVRINNLKNTVSFIFSNELKYAMKNVINVVSFNKLFRRTIKVVKDIPTIRRRNTESITINKRQ